jgi:NAD(P)-dependent dehydrogenase (short-subunit alcohol dehydrogenase family)
MLGTNDSRMNEADVRHDEHSKKHVALITDSSKGIGRAIVLAFVKSNTYAVIVVNARKQDEQGT